MSSDNFGSLGADFFIKTYDKGSAMSQADLDALVQYVQLTTTILAIGPFTPDEQESVWMILERVDVASVPDYTVTDNTEVTMTSGGTVTIDSIPWTKITGKPAFFSGSYADLTGKPTLFDGNYNSLTNKPNVITNADVNSLNGGDTFVTQTNDTVSLGQVAAQYVTVGPNGIQVAGTGGVTVMGVAGSTVTLGGQTSGNIMVASRTSGIDYNDLSNVPDLSGYATRTWVEEQGYGSGNGAGSSPANEITNTDEYDNTFSVSVSETGIVTMNTARGSLEFGAQPEEGAPQHLHIMRPADQGGATDLYFGDDYNYVKLPGNYGAGTLGVEIGANDGNGGTQKVWRFDPDGLITFPDNSIQHTGVNLGDIEFDSSTILTDVDQDIKIQASYRRTITAQAGPGTNLTTIVVDISENDDVVEMAGAGGWEVNLNAQGDEPYWREFTAATENVQENTFTIVFTGFSGADYDYPITEGFTYTFRQIASTENSWTYMHTGTLEGPGGAILSSESNELGEGAYYRDFAIELPSQDGTGEYRWEFTNSGTLTAPGNIETNGSFNGNIVLGAQGGLTFGDAQNTVALVSKAIPIKLQINDLLDNPSKTWLFGFDGDLTLPEGGDIVDSNGTSVLGGSTTHVGNTSSFLDVDTDDDVVRMQTTNTDYVGDYTFNVDNSGFTSATWNDNSIVIAGPSVDVYTAVWALTDYSSIFVTIGGVEYQVQNGGSNTPGHPQDVTLWTNNASPAANAVIDSIYIVIRTGEETFIEVDGSDIRMEAGDDIRIYAKDTFELVNRSGSDPIQITVDDNNSSKTWQFKVDGNLELPSGGTIVDSNGNDLLSGGGGSGSSLSVTDGNLELTLSDTNEDSYEIRSIVNNGSGTQYSSTELSYDRFSIRTNSNNSEYQWRFEDTGEFRIPGNINTYDNDINIIAMNAGTTGNITIKAVSNVNDIHYSQVQLTQSSVTITTDMDGTPGGKSFEFRDTGVLALPAGGDIVDSNGASVLSGGGGTTLPADASGYLNNNGSGTLSWVPGNPSGSGLLPYNAVTVVSNTTTADWTEFTLSGTMDSMWDYNNTVAAITLSSATAYGRTATVNTKNLWVIDAKVNSNNYLVVEFPTNPTPGDVFSVTSIVITQTVNAGSFVVGESYTITSVGTTDWMSIGAQYSGLGQTFVATGAGSGTGTASTTTGAKKLIFKPAAGQRARTMNTGQNGPVTFGQGGTYDFMFLDYSSQNVNSPMTWVYAGLVDGIPSWYHTYF